MIEACTIFLADSGFVEDKDGNPVWEYGFLFVNVMHDNKIFGSVAFNPYSKPVTDDDYEMAIAGLMHLAREETAKEITHFKIERLLLKEDYREKIEKMGCELVDEVDERLDIGGGQKYPIGSYLVRSKGE